MAITRFAFMHCTAVVAVMVMGGVNAQQSHFDVEQRGQSAAYQPDSLEGVGIDEKLEAQVPGDMVFTDSAGKRVRLGDLFDGERPVILTMNYASCPQLCGLQLNGFVKTLENMEDWTPGNQFRVVTISLDPNETAERSADFRNALLSNYGRREQVLGGWSFLRGSEEDIRHLADVVGFRYNFVEETGQYAHTAALMLLDPQGRVARYLYGIDFKPSTLRLSLSETADSKFVSTIDALILRCFMYDAASGSFVADAWNLTRYVLSFLALFFFAFLAWLFRLERKTRKAKVA